MAANFQQMGGGQMMPQQQGRPPQQRPSGGPNLQQIVLANIQQNTGPVSGWQVELNMAERLQLVLALISNLRLVNQAPATTQGVLKLMEMAIKFEKDIFDKAQSKDQYKQEIQGKMQQLIAKREQNQAGLQQSINAQAQAQAQNQVQQQTQAQAHAQAQQQMMMNQNSMQGQMVRNMSQQPPQQQPQQPQQPQPPFHHLQHQMQASPLPGQQPQGQQAPGQVPSESLPQHMAQNQQQSQMGMQQGQPQQQNPPGRPMNAPPPFTQQETAMIVEHANRQMAQASNEEKNKIRATMQQRAAPMQLQRYRDSGIDPVVAWFRSQAAARLRQEKAHMAQQMQASQGQAQHMGLPQQPQNGGNQAPPMQQQRSMNPGVMPGQPGTSMAGNADFGPTFASNMESIIGQQQQAGVMAQEAGQMVVPATQRNATPQPNGMPGQQLNLDQRAQSNPNNRIQAQQIFNLQQQQKMQNAAQQQSQQAQIRAHAQQKAAHMALQGQPGGMGPGPVPPQQSPALGTLNTPLRAPNQPPTQQDPGQMNSTPQLGQAFDQRFAQGNQRPPVPPGLNPAMFAQMSQDQQNALANMPPDRLNEFVARLQEQQRMQALQGRLPGQQGGPPRPGQQPTQPGQFMPQQPMNQFTMNNPNRQPGPPMPPGLNPQQQMMLQQQMARNQQNQMQRGPQVATGIDMRMLMHQLENADFPPILREHQQAPRGIPPDIKKWAQLKAWASQAAPTSMEFLHSVQRTHAINIVNTRNKAIQGQNQPMAGPMPPQAAQNTMNMAAQGMPAPVAPMGQAPVQMPGAANMAAQGMRQPTPADLMRMRNHPSGKFASMTDDQLREILRNSRIMQQQRAPQQQMNGQAPQVAGPNLQGAPLNQPQAGNTIAFNQPPPMSVSQPMQPTPKPAPEQFQPALNTNRAPRPTNNRQPRQSSPGPAAKNLKRAGSDDVVEVPNPNAQRPSRATPQMPKQPQRTNNLGPQQGGVPQTEARKRQEAIQGNATDLVVLVERWNALRQEEQRRASQPRPTLQMNDTAKMDMAKKLSQTVRNLAGVSKVAQKWYTTIAQDDVRARTFIRGETLFRNQFRDKDMTQVKESFTMRMDELNELVQTIQSIAADITSKHPTLKKGDSSQQQPAVTPKDGSHSDAKTLTAANLHQQQQQLNKMSQKPANRGVQTPAAPTSSHAPFHFGATSPQGLPSYVGKPSLTQDNLHLPARKKQKPNSAGLQPTSASTIASPQLPKPSDSKEQQPLVAAPAQPSFVCSEKECDRHTVGFNTQEELKRHTYEEHVKVLQDPLKYASDNLASMLGLDLEGRSMKQAQAGQASSGIKMVSEGSKQGQTPNIKVGNTPKPSTASPIARQSSMQRQASTTANSSNVATKLPTPASTSKENAKTPTKISGQHTSAGLPSEAISADAWANATIDPNELFNCFNNFESGAGGAIHDINVYRSLTPNDTPESSKDGASEPNSDISDGVALDINVDIFDESWMPFGAGDAELANMGAFGGEVEDLPLLVDQAQFNPLAWEDVIEPSLLDKPFTMDTSLFSMEAI